MVYKCCVPGCNTGYKTSTGSKKIPLFGFPKEELSKKKWITAIPRQDWTVNKYHKVCSKHFSADDFETTSIDQHHKRRNERENLELKKARLKITAIPHIFPGLPKYLSRQPSNFRTSSASSSSRLEKENMQLEKLNENLRLEDAIDNFETLKRKIKEALLPSGYMFVLQNTSIVFNYLLYNDDISVSPKLKASVIVTEELTVSAFVSSIPVPQNLFQHFLDGALVKSISNFCNILAFCKSLAMNDASQKENYLTLAVSSLEQYLACEPEKGGSQLQCYGAVNMLLLFIIEQIKMATVPKQGRRYSSDVITLAFLWQLTSTALYKKLRDIFILPSIGTLRKYYGGMSVNSGSLDLCYLKQRTSSLSQQERIVTLMIDEVYTAQRIEYSNGSFVGLTEDGAAAKTVLAFMVQSTCSKYKDIVCLVPVNKLNTALLQSWYNKVMLALHDIFFVVALSTDNHVCNRKMFVELCDGELKASVDHPTRPGEQLFLLFDFTHNFKNIFNNFLNKKYMSPPVIGFEHILGSSCNAQFVHLKQLYVIEESKSLKIAHKIRKASLNPSSIARTSPQHALSIFHETTANALEYYSTTHPDFLDTCRYIRFIGIIWKIMSLKSPSKGLRKRDEFCEPFSCIEGVCHKGLQYIQDAIAIMKAWRTSGRVGLTTETFTACIQSMDSMCQLSNYLLHKHRFQYVLSGKFSSDPIEGRFGWYRQVNGGNFFMSAKQLLQAERKIRCLSLLQQQALQATSLLPTVAEENATAEDNSRPEGSVAWLSDFLAQANLDDFSASDAAVTYFVAGYIARSISRRRKCSACKELLIKNMEVCCIENYISSDQLYLLNMADRGGLSRPTDYCFAVCAIAVHFYAMIQADDCTKKRFLSFTNQRCVFVRSCVMATESSFCYNSLVTLACSDGHVNFDWILQTSFNCFAKNELKHLNTCNIEPPAKMSRTIRKLSSKISEKS